MEEAKAKKKLTVEEKKYQKTCQLCGVWSLTELRFVSKRSLLAREGIGRETVKYIDGWLSRRRLTYGGHTLEDYLEHRKRIWSEATGFIVFRYKVRSVLASFGVTNEWAVGRFVPAKNNFSNTGTPRISFRGVTGHEAQELIEDAGLVPTHLTSDGEIYDTPDAKFLKHFGNGGSVLAGANNISITTENNNEDDTRR